MQRIAIVMAMSVCAIGMWLVLSWPTALVRWGSPEGIRAYILRQTPAGSDVDAVRRWLAARGALLDERGLPQVRPALREPMIDDSMLNPDYFYEVRARLASPGWLSPRAVTATYRFDRNNQLTGVRVDE